MKHRKTPSCISSSAAIIGGNDDLLMEILPYLPPKSLIRFKLVNKHWLSLISTPSFAHLHALRYRRRPEYAFLLRIRTFPSQIFICDPSIRRLVPFYFNFGFPYVKIIQSCNGLLLIECGNSKYSRSHGRSSYYIFNPTTRQSRNLKLPKRSFYKLCLIFNPSESPHYKVIMFPSNSHGTDSLVYHSENDEWNSADGTCFATHNFWIGFAFNNGVYFVKSRFSSDRVHWMDTPEPIDLDAPFEKSYTIESNGFLHHLTLSENILHVYGTKEIERGWSEEFVSTKFNAFSNAFPWKRDKGVELLGLIRGEALDDSVLWFHVPGKIMIYRFRNQVFEELVDFTRELYYLKDELQFLFDDDVRSFEYSLAPV